MNEIQRVIARAAWRMHASNVLKGMVIALAGLLALAIIARIVEQVVGLRVPWAMVGYVSAGAVVLFGGVIAIVQKPTRMAVARRVDEGADLRESLSTALYCTKTSDDPWSRVTIDTASRTARGVNVKQAVPIAAPRFWPVVLALALAFAVVFIAMPRVDVLGWNQQRVAQEKTQAEIVQAKQQAQESTKKLEELTKDLELDKEAGKGPEPEKVELKDPEAIRKSAIKELTKLEQRLQDLRSGEKGQKLDALKNTLKQLRQPGPETAELSKALATGNFEQAREELLKLEKKLGEDGEKGEGQDKAKNEQAKKEAQKQLKELAEQMKELAKQKQDLEKALENAGLDKKLASDPAAMNKAIDEAQGLNQQQKDALKESASAAAQAGNSMEKLAQAAQQMAESAQKGDQQGMQEAGQEMGEQLSQMEQLSQEMSQAEAAMNEAQAQMGQLGSQCKGGQCKGGDKDGEGEGQGKWSASWSESQSQRRDGPRTGGGGIGQGGQGQRAQADFDTKKERNLGPLGAGPIVGTRLVEGESIKGESTAQYATVVSKAEQGAAEAIENNQIPAEYRKAVQNYFGNLKGKAKGSASDAKPSDAKPAAPAKPAEAAKDADKK